MSLSTLDSDMLSLIERHVKGSLTPSVFSIVSPAYLFSMENLNVVVKLDVSLTCYNGDFGGRENDENARKTKKGVKH